MTDIRAHFHEQLDQLQASILEMGETCEAQVGRAVSALLNQDLEAAREVIAVDDRVDGLYLDIHKRWIQIAAEQNPMASDLRWMVVMLHMAVTLERMGDQAANIAKITQLVDGLPTNAEISGRIQEMSDLVRPMVRVAIDAFARRAVDAARQLPKLDDPVDRLNWQMTHLVLESGDDPDLRHWATRMLLVSRALERVGDQAVDIGEQVVFMETGQVEEFSGSVDHDD